VLEPRNFNLGRCEDSLFMANATQYRNWAGVSLVGRLLLSAIFILSGVSKLLNFGTTHQIMVSHGVPLAALFLLGAIAIEICAGLSLLLGLQARWGAALLFIYMIPVTFIFHDFWVYQGVDRQMQLINFLKNLAIMGGLAQLVAMGPGPISVDASGYHRRRGLDSRDSTIRLRRVS
jgi:putative oxidoreductase